VELTAVFTILLLGSMIQGATGFGYAIFSMPLLSLFIPLELATVLIVLTAFVLNFQIFYQRKENINWKLMGSTLGSALVGTFIGVWGLEGFSSGILRMLLGIILIIFSLYFIFYYHKIKIKPSLLNSIIAGGLGGIINGMFGMGGPPLVIYYFSAAESKEEYQGCLQATFLVMLVYAVGFHFLYGNITTEVLPLVGVGVVGVLTGAGLGLKIFDQLKKSVLRRVISVLMTVTGLMMIFKGLQ